LPQAELGFSLRLRADFVPAVGDAHLQSRQFEDPHISLGQALPLSLGIVMKSGSFVGQILKIFFILGSYCKIWYLSSLSF
jgi:hypothetical protein